MKNHKPLHNYPRKHPNIKPIALAIAFTFSVGFQSDINAATFTVLNTADQGSGSLRRAILNANNTAGDDTIVFDASLERATINLTNGELVIGSATSNDGLTITGPLAGQANGLVINAGTNSRVFNVQAMDENSGSLTLENLTITGGLEVEGGGGIRSENTALTLNDSVVTNNATTGNTVIGTNYNGGGGILNLKGDITINRSVISSNSTLGEDSDGGGFYHKHGIATINGSKILANSTNNKGGGAFLSDTENTNISYTEFSENESSSEPSSGLFQYNDNIEINHSTFSNNIGLAAINLSPVVSSALIHQTTISDNKFWSGNPSKGLDLRSFNTTITNSTITNNSTGISTRAPLGSILNLENSILSGNTEDNIDIQFFSIVIGTTLNVQSSLFGDPFSEINGANVNNHYYTDPDLGPLQNNGASTTKSHHPNIYSPAVDLGDNALVSDTSDQRGSGFARIQGASVDIGSVESQPIPFSGDYEVIRRRDMVKAMLSKFPNDPPLGYATGLDYHDVQAIDTNANWIEKFKTDLYTEGCDTDKFCGNSTVSRVEMAKLFLKVKYGAGFTPQIAQGAYFADVNTSSSFNIDWVNKMYEDNFTDGCGVDSSNNLLYCPQQPVTKEWFVTLLMQLP